MVQIPTATMVTVLPETVQTAVVVEVNVTGRPEEALAAMANGAAPTVTPVTTGRIINWSVKPPVRGLPEAAVNARDGLPAWRVHTVLLSPAPISSVSPLS